MADFQTIVDNIRTARSDIDALEKESLRLREHGKSLTLRLQHLKRRFNGDSPEDEKLQKQLDDDLAAAQAAVVDVQAKIVEARRTLDTFLSELTAFADPQTAINKLSDDIPLLLFPVRLETRFKTLDLDGVEQVQLCVRIYPDACLIDNFEEVLSETELRNAQQYWQNRWRAGKQETDLLAAWTNLVSSHGAGRAEWIQQSYRPQNIADEPGKASASDVILVISVTAALPAAELPAIETFWRAMWQAAGDVTREAAALDQLQFALGPDRSAEVIRSLRPVNFDENPSPPLSRADVAVEVATLILHEKPSSKQQAWTRAPRVNLLPNRFVLMGYQGSSEVLNEMSLPVTSPLYVATNPSAPQSEQLHLDDKGDLKIPEELRWMVDFEQALSVGMAFKVTLTAQQAQGFDRLLVLGIRLESDHAESAQQLSQLLTHHHFGRSGLALIPQGTPTNNIEGQSTNYAFVEDPQESFDRLFGSDNQFPSPTEPLQKADGHWLAEWLGIKSTELSTVAHSHGLDQSDVRAMNRALWPATGDYFLRTVLHPMFSDDTLDHVRWYFTQFVSGRGFIPAIRIGKQPYGILPVTQYSKIGWLDSERIAPERLKFVSRLVPVLNSLNDRWTDFQSRVSSVSTPASDPHQTLLDILGLQPTSAEFHFRFASSLPYLFSLNRFAGRGAEFLKWLDSTQYQDELRNLLKSCGYTGPTPDLAKHFYYARQSKLLGPLVDVPPGSETAGLQKAGASGENYIQWLSRFARKDFDALRQQLGFIDNQPPRALLYLLLRHAVILGYHDCAYRLFKHARQRNPGVISAAELEQFKREPDFVHLFAPTAETGRSESRWRPLYERTRQLLIPQDSAVHQFIAFLIRKKDPNFADQLPFIDELDRQLEALSRLTDRPIAKLERALVEHLDCCSYRLDAWRQGIVHLQLAQMRYQQVEDKFDVARSGIYLGAYGWLENVRSEHKVLERKELSSELTEAFANVQPAFTDSTNGGFILAPSQNHAVTAAVLRNGYLSQATPANHQTLQVNLSSERVRVALSYLEGMRQGQSLGALLGYQLERGLHDRNKELKLDALIYDLRRQFPLRANQFEATAVENVPIDKLEARNVIDGLKLIEQIRQANASVYPFGLLLVDPGPNLPANALPKLDTQQQAAIQSEVDRLLDIHDALADLAMAESVHQAAQGNYDRAAATLATFTVGNHPPDPSVIRTPQQGTTLTHRVGIHFRAGLAAPAGNASPKSIAEPALNDWLNALLPQFDQIACTVKWRDPISNAEVNQLVTLADLKLQPLDLLQILRLESDEAMSELDGRILDFVYTQATPRPDASLHIHYMDRGDRQWTVTDISALNRTLANLLQQSRPLNASDLTLQFEATQAQRLTSTINPDRITSVHSALVTLHDTVSTLRSDFEPMLSMVRDGDVAQRTLLISQIDEFIARAIASLKTAALFSVPQSGISFAITWKHERFFQLAAMLRQLVNRWSNKHSRHLELLNEYDDLPAETNDADRFALLQLAESEISTQLRTRPDTPADLKLLVVAQGAAFEARRLAFDQLLVVNTTSLAEWISSIAALLPISSEDSEPLELSKVQDEVVRFAGDLLQVVEVIQADLKKRADSASNHLAVHNATSDPQVKVESLTAAARAMLGDEFILVPEFTVATAQANEWRNSIDQARSGALLNYLTEDRQVDFPVDQWLYGVARVREPMRQWERVVMLAGALGIEEPDLVPAQFPFQPEDSWLGLDYPPKYRFERDRLLYTAHYQATSPFDQPQCGLLIDQWAELVPNQDPDTQDVLHESAISFHYDRPNTEAPQTWLLVTPASWDGHWDWSEVVGAVQETFVSAKNRAVEPEHMDGILSHFLPAVALATTATEISISTYLARNNPKFDG